MSMSSFTCGLEGSGFIVAIGLTLLVSGVVVYYCNSRLSSIEESVRNQNKVLSDFITHVQSGIMDEGEEPPAAQGGGAVDAVRHINLGDGRIGVSDDDSESGSDSDESGSGSESESDGEDDGNTTPDAGAEVVEKAGVQIDEVVEVAEPPVVIQAETIADPKADGNATEVEVSADRTPSSPTLRVINLDAAAGGAATSEGDNGDNSSMSSDSSVSSAESPRPVAPPASPVVNLSGMKVGELRSLAVEKALVDGAVAKSLKKPALVSLLQEAGPSAEAQQ